MTRETQKEIFLRLSRRFFSEIILANNEFTRRIKKLTPQTPKRELNFKKAGFFH